MLPAEALHGRASELSLMEYLGPPTGESEPLGDDPCLFWDIEWDCGLVMSIEFHQLSQTLHVTLDAPEFAHALRHMGATIEDLELTTAFEKDDLDRPIHVEIPLDWEVVAEADGEASVVATGLCERDASCLHRSLTEGGDTGAGRLSVRRVA